MKDLRIHRRSVIALGFFLCTQIEIIAQSAKDVCLDEVRAMYKGMQFFNPMQPKEDKTYYMSYSVRTVPKDSLRDGISVSETKIWASGKNLEVSSEHMSVYQDGDDAFIVLPQKKMIMRNDPYVPGSVEEKKLSRFRFIQDTLFSMSKTSQCRTLNDGTRLVVLDVNEKGQEKLSVRRLSFVIDINAKQFKKVKIEYTAQGGGLANQLSHIEYAFQDVSFDYRKKQPADNVSSLFMRTDKELNEKYRGYELVDNRYKKNKSTAKQLK